MAQSITFQRLEALAIFVASILIYLHLNFNFIVFIALLLVFDLSMAGYLVNNKAGAFVYNLGHSLLIPTIIFTAGFIADSRLLLGLSLIWLAHIGLDRSLGYGLKLSSGFNDTHLGQIGKRHSRK
jgi:hypothetical protein